jgi:aspartate racemase
MKIIGLIGGVSYPSTIWYYKKINENVETKIIINSVVFSGIKKLIMQGNWEELTKILTREIRILHEAGADCIGICSNTLHRCIAEIIKETGGHITIIDMVKETVAEIKRLKLKKIGLLGIKEVMQGSLYKSQFQAGGIDVVPVEEEDVKEIERIIFEELNNGIVLEKSRGKILQIIYKIKKAGANGIVLGCTALPTLLENTSPNIPIINTAEIHINALVKFAKG